MSPDRHCPQHAAHPGPAAPGSDDLRREGPGHGVPADRAVAAARRAPQRAGRAARRRRLRCVQRLRRAVPHADRGAAGRRWPEVQPLPHHGAVRADPAGAAHRPQPPLGRHGQHHRDRHLGAGQQLAAAQHQGAAGDDAQAERLLDRPVRQVPRGAGLADLPDGPVRRLAVGRRRLRDVLRLHRRREQPVRPGAVRRHHAGRAAGHRGGGLPPHRGPGRPGGATGCGSRRR